MRVLTNDVMLTSRRKPVFLVEICDPSKGRARAQKDFTLQGIDWRAITSKCDVFPVKICSPSGRARARNDVTLQGTDCQAIRSECDVSRVKDCDPSTGWWAQWGALSSALIGGHVQIAFRPDYHTVVHVTLCSCTYTHIYYLQDLGSSCPPRVFNHSIA